MVVGAIDAALEQGEVALNGVGVGVAAHVLVNAVIDALMVGELGAEEAVLARVDANEGWGAVNLRKQNGAEVCGAQALEGEEGGGGHGAGRGRAAGRGKMEA